MSFRNFIKKLSKKLSGPTLEEMDPEVVYDSDRLFGKALRKYKKRTEIGFRYVSWYDNPSREGPYFICTCGNEVSAEPLTSAAYDMEREEVNCDECGKKLSPDSEHIYKVLGNAVQVSMETYSGP